MTDAKLASLQHLPLPDAIRTLRRSLTDLEQLIDTHIPEEERESTGDEQLRQVPPWEL